MPLTIIIFILFSKWWIVDVVDGTDGIMYGFPFIYKAPAFYTSMAEEYFILELIADLIIYFGVVFGIVYLINEFLFAIKWALLSMIVGPTSRPFCFIVSPVSTISTIQSQSPTSGANSIEP